MKIKELREKIKNFPKYPGTKIYPVAPVIHAGFPSCFNLSFAEYEMLKEFNGQYLHCDHNFLYSKIQPCIRHQDWETIVSDEKNRYRYLSLFDMADVSGCMVLKDNLKQEEIAKFAIKSLIDFIKSVNLDIGKLKISYFKEADIEKATAGKYKIDKNIPTDPMINYWKELGIKENQLISDQTRDTLLSLRVFGLPTPWGYRNEIHYEHQGKLLDIATVEYMKYEPLFNNEGEIYDLTEYKHSIAIAGIGVERFNMLLNNLNNVWEVDTIQPLIDMIMREAKNKDELQAMILVQAFRPLHQIIADGGVYKSLNHRRKKYTRVFYKALFETFKNLEIDFNESIIKKLIDLNSKLQDYYPQLKKRRQSVLEEIFIRSEYLNNKK
jgi:alanyl-tRNA synthetase